MNESLLARRGIKIAFADMWSNFDPDANYFMQLLSRRFNVQQSKNPDFLIFSCTAFGKKHLDYDCVRIYYTGENERPDYAACDFAFSFDYSDDPRHYRLPLYVLYFDLRDLIKNASENPLALATRSRFCNFVYSNPRCLRRNLFFKKLSRYKRIDSGGRYLNNIGAPVQDKLSFLQDYKFTIAFENQSRLGYTTEKIIEPMRAGSIPIYWGNPTISKEFNPSSFINWHDYGSDEAVIERIIELDQNDSLYRAMTREPWLHGNQVPSNLTETAILDRFDEIFRKKITPIAVRRRHLRPYDQARAVLTRYLPWRARMIATKLLGEVVAKFS